MQTLQETFLRFEGITLPSDAIINNVYLVFYGDEASNSSTTIKIFGEIGNSSNYPTSTAASTGLNVKSRNYSTNFAQWITSGCVVNQEYQSPDLKNVVAEMFPNGMNNVNLAFRLQGNGQGAFTVRSFSAAVAQRPKLVIDYWSNFGSNTVTVSSNNDDGRENTNGGIVLGTAYLYLGGSSSSKNNGIRFQNVNIPADAEITNAYIEFYSYSTSPTGNIEIQTELNNANIYSVTSQNITNRNYSQSKISWNEPAITSNYKLLKTPNLKNIIDEARLTNWQDGDNLAFKFLGNATNNATTVRSYEGGVAYRPKLVIEFENNGNGPSITGAITDPALMTKLYINEVSSQGTHEEEEDWIELYNDSDEIYHIKGKVYISDKDSNKKKHELKNIIIQPKGYVVLIADEQPNVGNLHLNFDLKNTGESLYLSREVNGNLISQDEMTFGVIPFNQSYARIPNGTGEFVNFISATHNASNDIGKKLINVGLNQVRGIYENDFDLTLTVPNGVTIKYTLDGKFPNSNLGNVYNAPIRINKTTVVNLYAYDSQGNNSGVISHSFILKNRLNAELTNTSNNQWLYANNITSTEYATAMELVPIVSVTMDREPTSNWEYSSVEYLDSHLYPSRENFFSAAMTKRFGQESVNFFNPNLKYKFNKDASVKKPTYPFFDQYEGDIFETPEKVHTIELKQGQDNPSRNVFNLGFMRWSEKITMNLQKEMGKYALDTRYVQLFINGKYRGLKTMRNDFKTNNIAEVFGDDDENYTKVNLQDGYFTGGLVESGDGEQAVWNNIRNVATARDFQQFKSLVDVDDMIKFQILFMFIDTENEAVAITHNTNPSIMKAKFMINDTDGGFFGGSTTSSSNVAMPERGFAGGGGNYKRKWALTSSRNGPAGLFGRFMGSNSNQTTGNLEFKTLVKDAVLENIGPASGDFRGAYGATLSVDRVQAKMTEVLTELDPLYKVDAAYMGFRSDVYNLWKNVDYPRIIAQTPERVEYNLKKWLEYNMAHSLLEPQILSNQIISENENIIIVNPNSNTQVYYTLDGSDPMGNDGVVSNKAILYSNEFVLPSGNYTIIARAFTTNNWGPKSIKKIEVLDLNTGRFVISGINYKPLTNSDAEFILITNDGNSNLDISGYSISDAFNYTFPNETILQQGETVMLAKNLNLIEGFSNMIKYQWTSGSLSNSGEPITFKDPIGNVVDYVHYLSQEPWPVEANGNGLYLQLKSTFLNNELPESWKATSEESLNTVISTFAKIDKTEEENQEVVTNNNEQDQNETEFENLLSDVLVNNSVIELELILYPNPVKDMLNIDVNSDGYIEVFNLNGQLITKSKISEGNNLIETSQWSSGVYLINFKNDNMNKSYKVVKK